jgi:predicted amidophosphoribosyltransferase
MARIINCIDCNQPISEVAKMCPHCGRPWPKDGKSLIRKLSEKLFKFILSNLHYIMSILIMGVLLHR